MSESSSIEIKPEERGVLLAFLYRLRFDQQFNRAFKVNDVAVMRSFGLSSGLVDAIRSLGVQVHESGGSKEKDWKPIGDALAKELFELSRDTSVLW